MEYPSIQASIFNASFLDDQENEFPSSPNPNNTVTENQNLDSLESKFQLSLKTKA
jgi:phospholipase A1